MTPTQRKTPGFIICLAFLVVGLILTAVFGNWLVWLPLRTHLQYVETTCVVLDKRLEQEAGRRQGKNSRPLIHIEYSAGGRRYRVWTYDATGMFTNLHDSNRAVLQQFEKGQRYPCWYDPDDPEHAVLTRSLSWWGLLVLIPLTFAVVGGAGLIAIHRTRGTMLEPASGVPDYRGLPALPPLPSGRELTYRLASSSSPGCSLLGATAVTLFWNGIVWVFVVQVIASHQRGQPNWFLTLFMVPFVLIGLVLALVVLASLVSFLGSLLVGQLSVEVADQPLFAGSSYDLLVEQFGLCRLRSVRVLLNCKETATFTQGKSIRTDTKEVYSAEVVGPEPSLAGPLRCSVTVPADAMHSFAAAHNEITWTMEVKGLILGFLPQGRSYPVIVYPRTGANRT
jgi:hypothetical protein